MSFLEKRPKCPICKKKLKNGEHLHELRLDTLEGPHTVEICESCADFFDKSADAIRNNMTRRFEKQKDGKPV